MELVERQFILDEWVEIDVPIARLVQVLNEIPGVCTLNSCGGHSDQIYFDQVPEGCFYVSFAVDRPFKGWKALDLIVSVLGNDGRQLSLEAVNADDERPFVIFNLSGDGSIDANELAVRLSEKLGR